LQIKNRGQSLLIAYSANLEIKNSNVSKVELYKSDNNSIWENTVGGGVYLLNSSNNGIFGNNMLNSYGGIGIYLEYSSNNTVYGNDIAMNGYGIYLLGSSSNNISQNIIVQNSGEGICCLYSSYNLFYYNNVSSNYYGIGFAGGSNNKIFHNNFIDNAYQANSGSSVNTWDDGYPSGGNYWSDYPGLDLKCGPNQDQPGSDGIGDTPYVTGANDRDRYPLMPQTSPTVPQTWTVDDDGPADFHTIQEAINAANPRDTIYVHNGTYYENVIVTKMYLRLIGENREGTIIESNGVGTVVMIKANYVVINGFTVSNGYYGIFISQYSMATIQNNRISGNVVGINIEKGPQAQPICNLISENDISNLNSIVISGSSDNTIAKNDISGYYYGILLGSSSNNSIIENNITSARVGIYLSGSPNNTLCRNMVERVRVWDGYWFVGWGILLDGSSYNTLFENNVTENHIGIMVIGSGNKLYHNNFVGNDYHIYMFSAEGNFWDDGYPSGGNYWGDYAGVDSYAGPYQNENGSDGIGDTAYAIDANNTDRYPLVGPINVFDAGIWDGTAYNVDVVTNSTVSNFKLNTTEKTISFNVTGLEFTAGFCRVTIPNVIVEDLWQGNFTVLLNGEPWPFRNWTDTTNTYIYINYTHSEHEIIIVPEFPSAITLPLFMSLILVAAVLAKKRTRRKLKA